MLPGRTVTVTRDAAGATAIVSADVLTVIPFAAFHIQEQATAPLEIFVGTP